MGHSAIMVGMNTFMSYGPLISIIVVLWVLPWKGYSLWTAAKNSHKGWFIALLILNTFAILDIFYIFYVAKKGMKDIKHDLRTAVRKTPKEHKNETE
jgi:amino acid permease